VHQRAVDSKTERANDNIWVADSCARHLVKTSTYERIGVQKDQNMGSKNQMKIEMHFTDSTERRQK